MIETTRNISLIWLSFLCFIALAPPLVILYFAVRGLNWVTEHARPIFRRAREGSETAQEYVERYSTIAANPLIRVKGQTTRWQKTISEMMPK
ncbi:MAG: hypothetical protein U0175_36370 [Caldilineaceae bacterium]